MRHLLIVLFLLGLATPLVVAQSVTIGGTVRDKMTLLPVSGARVDLTNPLNPAEHYSISTDLTGQWQQLFLSTDVGKDNQIPAQFSLEQNYPNPFNPSTTIRFRVRWEGVVTLSVYDVLGQLLDRRSFGLAAGGYEIVWSSKGATGALFYSIESTASASRER